VNRPFATLASLASLATTLVLLVACGEQRPSLTTPEGSPLRSSVASPAAACSAADLTTLSGGIATHVVGRANQSTANKLLGDVRQACQRNSATPTTTAALAYTSQLVTWWKITPPATAVWSGDGTQFWSYLTTLFRYVGFVIDNDENVLGAQGFIKVCTASEGCEAIAKALTSGIKVFPGALSATGTAQFLVTGRPAACSGIDGNTDLQVWGQCIKVSIDPKSGTSFKFRNVSPGPVLVQTCLSETANAAAGFYLGGSASLPDGTGPRIRLAQKSAPVSTVSLRPRPADDSDYEGGFFTAMCSDATSVAALGVPSRTVTDYALRWFGRASSAVGRMLTPRPLFAGHAGLGGYGFASEASLFGPADPFTFQATFDNPFNAQLPNRTADVPGEEPKQDDLARAAWIIDQQAPGYVRVRKAPFSGFPATAGNVVEVNQAGGAAASKNGLVMLANSGYFESTAGQQGTFANSGKYRIRWTSLIASPRAGGTGALFVALGVGPAGQTPVELASFAYVNGPNAQSGTVHFNGSAVPGLSWQTGVRQRFELIVDLTGGKSYLRTVSIAAPDGPSAKSQAEARTFATNLSFTQAGWRLGRQDNQVIGMDDFEIVRLADTYDPSAP